MKKISLVLAAAMLLGLCGCGGADSAPVLQEPVAVEWQTAEAFRGDIATLQAYGAFVAAEMEEAAFEHGGKLAAVYVHPGDHVEAGQLLAELDSEALEESLADVQKSAWQFEVSYQYSLAQSESDLTIAELQLQEITGGKTLTVLKAAKSAKDAEVTALQAEITALETQIAALRESIAALETPAEPETEGAQTPGTEETPDALTQAKEALAAAEESLAQKREDLAERQEEAALLQEQVSGAEAADLQVRQLENAIAYLQDDYYLQSAEFGETVSDLEEQIALCSLYAENSGTVCMMTTVEPGIYVSGTLVYIAVDGTEYVRYSGGRDISRTTARVQANVGGVLYDMTLIPYSSAEYTALSRSGKVPAGRFAFPEGTRGMEQGSYVQLLLYSGTRENVILVPINTVYSGSAYAESHVYRIVDGEKVYTPVDLGIVNDNYAEIKSGLSEGDVVYVRD